MKYYGGCDVGSTYTKAVILDETGKIVGSTTIKSKINAEESARIAMKEVLGQAGLNSESDLAYLIGTGYGRNKVPFADENISEISCHAMGVHVADPSVKAVIDIGGQDVKGIAVDTDGTDGPGGFDYEGAPRCLAGAIVDGYTVQQATEKKIDLWSALKTHATSEPLWRLGCGVDAVDGVSALDLRVILIM